MPRPPIKEYKFTTYNTDKFLYEIERAGKGHTIDSEIRGSGYALVQNEIVISGGKNGMLSVSYEKLPTLLRELIGVYEYAMARKAAGIK